MLTKTFKPCTPSLRTKSTIYYKILSKVKSYKSLTFFRKKAKGKNNEGKITVRHRGAGHKKKYRLINLKYKKKNLTGLVCTIEYDPNRNAFISLIQYTDKTKAYILHCEGLKIGDYVVSDNTAEIKVGNSLPLCDIPEGTKIHNLEQTPSKGGTIARSAGTYATLLTKQKNIAYVRLPSNEIKRFELTCFATIGRVSNAVSHLIVLGNAGRSRHRGIRPKVRGVAMNAVDHPHGGGEGKSPVGQSSPVTPWGRPTLGLKTRKKKIFYTTKIKNIYEDNFETEN